MKVFKDDKLKESIQVFKVNGLHVYVMEKKQFSNVLCSFVVKYGSNDISFKIDSDKNFKRYPLGIAHFLEHKMFDGNEKDEVFKKFSKIGADVNAYTTYDVTNYYFNTTDKFEDCIRYLCEMIYGLNLSEESVESEKLVIEQEIKMYDDDPYTKVYRNFITTMYEDHPIRNDILGDNNTANAITKNHLEDCYENFYSNNNMFLTIVGNVDVSEAKHILSKYVKDKIKPDVIREKFNACSPINKHYVEENMGMNVPTNILGFKDMTLINSTDTDYVRKLIVFEMIHRIYFRATSDFYDKIYKSKIIDGSYYTEYSRGNDYGHYMFYGDGEKFKYLAENLFNYYSKYDFSKDKNIFDRVKRSMQGNYISLFNSVDNISNLMIVLIKNRSNLFEYFDVLNRIKLDDVIYEFKNIFNESNMVHSKIF